MLQFDKYKGTIYKWWCIQNIPLDIIWTINKEGRLLYIYNFCIIILNAVHLINLDAILGNTKFAFSMPPWNILYLFQMNQTAYLHVTWK